MNLLVPESAFVRRFRKNRLDPSPIGNDNSSRMGSEHKIKSEQNTQNAAKLRDLDIEIRFLEGILESDPQYIEALEAIASDYTERGLYKKGLEADLRLTALKPKDPLAHYNLGCSYSLTGQEEKSADTLETAILLGYNDFDYMDKDPDLNNLRAHPAYQKIDFLKKIHNKKHS
jgi:tetratricopeptide (TPR) repeat protein